MDPCIIATLAGVIVGAVIGRGVPTHETSKLLNRLDGAKVSKLLRLLELLEEPDTPTSGGDNGDRTE